MRKDNQDVVGDKCVKDDSCNLSFDNEAKKVAWKQHYERLLNEEFSWNPEDLTADPIGGPPIHIDVEMVVKAITKMKTGKAAGPSGIVAEMLKASGDTGARLVADLANDMVRNGVIPSDWEDSFIINIYKGKVMLWREVTTEVSNSLIMSIQFNSISSFLIKNRIYNYKLYRVSTYQYSMSRGPLKASIC